MDWTVAAIAVLTLVVIVAAFFICSGLRAVLEALGNNRETGNSLLGQLVGFLRPKEKAAPPSWVNFTNWVRPAVEWAKYQKLIPNGKFDWSTFNWHSFRSGEMYVDGGTGAGEPNIAHPTLKIGPKAGPLGVAHCVGFSINSEGHTTLANVITPCFETKPDGIVVTEVTIKGFKQAVVMAGPIQSALGDAITDCVAAGFLPDDHEMLQDLCWIGQGFAYPFADNDERLYYNNYVAFCMCIIKAVLGLPTIQDNQKCDIPHGFRGTVLENRRGQIHDTKVTIPRAPRPQKLAAQKPTDAAV